MKQNEILDLSFQFALDVVEYVDLLEEKRKYVIARQLLKSGTSIGANIREAQNVHSLKDFVAKCIIAMKEADETEYWLLLCEKSKSYPNPDGLLTTIVSIKKLLAKIISTSRKKLNS